MQQKRCQSLLRLDRCSLVPSVASKRAASEGEQTAKYSNDLKIIFPSRSGA